MDKTALVLGSCSSIGIILCRQLAQLGYNLIVSSRDEESLDSQVKDLQIRYSVNVKKIPADFTQVTFSSEDFIEEVGSVDTLFVLSGIYGEKNYLDSQNIGRIVSVNFLVPVQIVTLLAKKMEEAGEGNIVVISSISAETGREKDYPLGAAKAGLETYLQGLARKMRKSNVNVTIIKPAFVDTPNNYNSNIKDTVSRRDLVKRIIRSYKTEKRVVYIPFYIKLYAIFAKIVPDWLYNRLGA